MPTTAWNPELYTQKHSFVYQYGEGLVDLLNAQPNERILDLGCGTGELTDQISKTGADVIGIDSSADLLVAARREFPKLTFRHQNATELADTYQYDAVFSNATLHWILDQQEVTQRMFRSLKSGGRLVVELGGQGNVQCIRQALTETLRQYGYVQQAQINLWYFPSVGQYTTLLEQHGFYVQTAHHYARPTPLADADNGVKDWLKMFANHYLKTILSEEQAALLEDTQSRLRPNLYYDGQWHADYQRLRVTAMKPLL